MTDRKFSGRAGKGLRVILAATALTAVPGMAWAQEAQQAQPKEAPIGPPQLRDFQLERSRRIVTQPTPAPQPTPPPAQRSEPEPAPQQRQPAQRTAPAQRTSEPARTLPPAPRAPVPTAPRAPAATQDPAPRAEIPAPEAAAPAPAAADTAPLPPAAFDASPVDQAPAAPAPAALPPVSGGDQPAGLPLWLLLLGGLALGLGGYFFVTRRASQRRALASPAPEAFAAAQPQPPRAPRPDPVPRAWLELELTPERTKADFEESVVEFEITIRNNGGSTASNIRMQAKLICSTPEQDQEIAAFHKKKPGEHRTLTIPDIPAGQELRFKGSVDIKRDQIKVLKVQDRLLFVPLIAVNAFYSWGTERTGQTSKSFLIGREQTNPADKMAPFRLDLGPRVYRTVGQRPYKVERRV